MEVQYSRDGAPGSRTPESTLPRLGNSCHRTQENRRRGTPDSYLQLLIESCEDARQSVSDLIHHEGTQESSTADQKNRPIRREVDLKDLKEPCNKIEQITSSCISESLLLQPVEVTQMSVKTEKMIQSSSFGAAYLQELPASGPTTQQIARSSSPDVCPQMTAFFLDKDARNSEISGQLVHNTRLSEHQGDYKDGLTSMVGRRESVNITATPSNYLGYPHEELRRAK